MKKGFLVLFLCLVLAGCGKDENIYAKGENTIFDYEIIDNQAIIKGFGDNYKNQTKITIPYSIDKYIVNEIADNAFLNQERLESIVCSDSTLTKIGNKAFQGCDRLTSFTLQGSVSEIGSAVFMDCEALKEVNLENSKITSLPESTFQNCALLDTIKLPKEIISIENNAFNNCASLTEVNISETKVATIGDYAFANMSELTNIVLPSSLTTIGERAFLNDAKLKTINLNQTSLTTLKEGCFKGCKSIAKLALPSSLETISDGAFEECSSIKTINLSNTKITEIPANCFISCKALESVTLPNNLAKIKNKAFSNCALISITIPANVNEIGLLVFEKCNALIRITVDEDNNYYKSDEGVLFTHDGKRLLHFPSKCSKIDYILPNTLEEIDAWAFRNASELKNVYLQNTAITKIDKGTFWGCQKLVKVIINDDTLTIGESAFSGCASLSEVQCGLNLKLIDVSAFFECESLAKIDIENTKLETIEAYAFYNCNKISSLEIPSTTTTIADTAFMADYLDSSNEKLEIITINSETILASLVERKACGGLISNVELIKIKSSIAHKTPAYIIAEFEKATNLGDYVERVRKTE